MASIVVYYSRAGYNYTSSGIKALKVGNTEVVANKIAGLTDSDLFKIVEVEAYPTDYKQTTERAKKELNENKMVEYIGNVDLDQYDTIYLGYPNWWGTYPMVVKKFIEDHQWFNHKTVVPFVTHEGSGLGHSVADLKQQCPYSNVVNGLAIRGSSAAMSDNAIRNFLNDLKGKM